MKLKTHVKNRVTAVAPDTPTARQKRRQGNPDGSPIPVSKIPGLRGNPVGLENPRHVTGTAVKVGQRHPTIGVMEIGHAATHPTNPSRVNGDVSEALEKVDFLK